MKKLMLVISLLLFSVLFFDCSSNNQKNKVDVEQNTKKLSLCERTDLVCFNNTWFVVIQNHKDGEQITLKDSIDKSINTYPYSFVVGYKDFKSLTNPMPNNDYSKTLLNYFVGVSN